MSNKKNLNKGRQPGQGFNRPHEQSAPEPVTGDLINLLSDDFAQVNIGSSSSASSSNNRQRHAYHAPVTNPSQGRHASPSAGPLPNSAPRQRYQASTDPSQNSAPRQRYQVSTDPSQNSAPRQRYQVSTDPSQNSAPRQRYQVSTDPSQNSAPRQRYQASTGPENRVADQTPQDHPSPRTPRRRCNGFTIEGNPCKCYGDKSWRNGSTVEYYCYQHHPENISRRCVGIKSNNERCKITCSPLELHQNGSPGQPLCNFHKDATRFRRVA